MSDEERKRFIKIAQDFFNKHRLTMECNIEAKEFQAFYHIFLDYQKLQKENEELENQEKRTIIFIDSQIRCFDRKIKEILSIKKERCLSERERRYIKYLVGKKDECEKIKSKINKLKEN